ncbi:MAG: damage-inducible protein DinB [Oscillatoriophycideae cyanobacterium NC_groundwater_1537_Pr4_S-0.65um_50_18]|nr:damage-inducible protein DinB [Oscillatoriophycideae cyanobacterium NC_groundwater_1537_Pr4_S-0.65um_50_18]
MITPKFLEMMALYNKWQNETLLHICDDLSHEQLYVERKMFFGSIFKTLNHILYVDKTIHTLIHTKTLPAIDLTVILYAEYNELKSARFEFDEILIQDSQCSQDWLNEVIEFWSKRLNRHSRMPRSFYYMQLFNHQTHHRSQITSELHKMGIDYGSTDLPYNPYY